MNYKQLFRLVKLPALVLVVVALAASPSYAQTTYDLCASDGNVTMPDSSVVPIWGYADITGGAPCTAGLATLPGPELRATVGHTLTINLTNALGDPVSIFTPGIRATAAGSGGMFTAEAAANGGTASYTFSNIKAGTYLYHSGTDIRTQVPMGLYGVLVVDVVPNQAYGDVPYDQDTVILYSEINPDLNADPAGFGGARVANWSPQYFLVNGKAQGDVEDIGINISEDVLLRFVNAGLRTFVPTIDGGLFMGLIAEDGNRYPQPLLQYGIELPAGKTIDAMVSAGSDGAYPIYDRAASYDSVPFNLVAGAVTGAPVAVADAYSVAEDGSLTTIVDDAIFPDVLKNDTGDAAEAVLDSGPSAGTLVGGLALDGTFTYIPNADYTGIDVFTYKANNGLGGPNSNVAAVTITINPINDGPNAVPDYYEAVAGEMLSVAEPGVLDNDSDPDGDGLTVSPIGISPPGILALNSDGSFDYTPAGTAGAVETFDYEACDAEPLCSTATVTITVVGAPANVLPFANDDFAQTERNSAGITFSVTANDVDPDGTIDAATVVITTGPNTQRGGTVSANTDGTVTYVPKRGFRGTDTFQYEVNDDSGATSNVATVRVNVVKP